MKAMPFAPEPAAGADASDHHGAGRGRQAPSGLEPALSVVGVLVQRCFGSLTLQQAWSQGRARRWGLHRWTGLRAGGTNPWPGWGGGDYDPSPSQERQPSASAPS